MTDDGSVCEKCGAFGSIAHAWVEGDCVLPHRLTKPKHIPPATVGFVCTHCIDRWRDTLKEITELAATVADVVDLGSVDAGDEISAPQGKHKKKPTGSPAPVRLEAWAMLHDTGRLNAVGPMRDDRTFSPDYIHTATPDVWAVLLSWVDTLYEHMRVTADDLEDRGVAGLCNTLSTYAETIAHTPFVDDFDAELRWLRTALRRAHGLSDPRPLGKCMNTPKGDACDGQVWRDEEDPKHEPPKCDKCGRKYLKMDLVIFAAQVEAEKKAAAS